ncbi:hypothetical protein HDU93_000306 [Gonapodya sp. JEL0774]|nr:hypothetical protein HDU93_000306 [Gonapodya sp. JEL0774]
MADSDRAPNSDTAPLVAFKYMKSRAPKNIRKRERSPSPVSNAASAAPVRKTARAEQNLLSTSSVSSRAASRSAATADPDGIGKVSFAGTGSAGTAVPDFATRTLETEDNKGRAGMFGQKGLRAGPQRATTNVRISTRFDYQPDICKDYKETGYCGYGDSCKFLHDRGDYKAGWVIEREWEEKQRKKEKEESVEKWLIKEGDLDDDDEEAQAKENDGDVPFACLICRKEFTEPVVTRCGHYFCERCALSHHSKSPKCFACGAATGGVFHSVGKDVRAKMKAAAARMDERDKEIEEQMKEMGEKPAMELDELGQLVGQVNSDDGETEGKEN